MRLVGLLVLSLCLGGFASAATPDAKDSVHPLVDDQTVNLWLFDSALGGNVVNEVPDAPALEVKKPFEVSPAPAGLAYRFSDKTAMKIIVHDLPSYGSDSGAAGEQDRVPFTLEVWCQITAKPTQVLGMIYQQFSYVKAGWRLGLNQQNQLIFFIENPKTKKEQTLRTKESLPMGRWLHLAATYDGKKLALYIDGKQVATQPYAGLALQWRKAASIGYGSGKKGYPFNGLIRAIRISKGARTDFSASSSQTFPASEKQNKPAESAQWIQDRRPTKIYMNLAGMWEGCPLVGAKDFVWPLPETGWQSVIIPPPDANVGLKPDSRYTWFRRSFEVSEAVGQQLAKNDRAILHFGGVGYRWQARLNGKLIIDSMDGFTSRDVDVTNLLRLDAENELVIGTSNRNGLAREGASKKELAAYRPPWLLLAPAALRGVSFPNSVIGIWGEVELWARPAQRIADVFVRSSVRKKKLDIDLELLSKSKGNMLIDARVFDANQKEVLSIDAKAYPLLGKGIQKHTLSINWPDPKLWAPENPYLYRVQVRMLDATTKKVIDIQQVTFGFREIWIDGEDVMFNGRRLFLARNSQIAFTENNPEFYVKRSVSRKSNALRMHIGGFYRPGAFAWHTDRDGTLLIPEMPWSFGFCYAVQDPRFWKNYREMTRRWVRSARNHPSIVMWSLGNENIWTGISTSRRGNPKSPQLMKQVGDMVKRIDPTRVIQFDGDTDLRHKNYCETVNLHYPWETSDHWYPTECWAFENPPMSPPLKIRGSPAGYVWKRGEKPIIVGEFSCNLPNFAEAPVAMTMYLGDRAYDWEVWKPRTIWRKLIRWQCDAWRVARYAGINPWYHKTEFWPLLMPLETVVLKDQYRSFFSNEKASLRAFLLNDTLRDRDYTVSWAIQKGSKTVFTAKRQFQINGGDMQKFDLTLDLPSVTKPAGLVLEISVTREGKVVNTETYALRVRPKARLVWPSNTVLFDPMGRSMSLFTDLGILPQQIKTLRRDLSAKAIVLGENALKGVSPKKLNELLEFANAGGNVLYLGGQFWPEKNFLQGIRVKEKARANHSWVRASGHPVLKNMTDADLSLWRDGDWLNQYAFEKPRNPTGYAWRALVDIGSAIGLGNATLLEVFSGKGRFILNQMNLAKAKQDPGARAYLANLLQDVTRKSLTRGGASLLATHSSVLEKALANMAIPVSTKTLPEKSNKAILVDAGMNSTKPNEVAAWVRNGGTVFLNGLSVDNQKRWRAVMPKGLKVAPWEPIDGCMITTDDPILWGVSNEELFWAVGYWTERKNRVALSKNKVRIDKDLKHGVRRVADIANATIQIPGGVALLRPSTLVRVQDGKGTWILSTLNFAAGMSALPMKTYRLMQSIFTNLGFKPDSGLILSFGNFKSIPIAKYVNRGFQDDQAGNGKGGWSDQGKQDLRFFPVNISGLDLEGMPMPVPDFPTRLVLADVPFQVIDPRQNQGKSIIALTPNYKRLTAVARGDYLDEVKNIPINRKFGRLYSLHSSAWTLGASGNAVWRYVLHYADGSTATIPIRKGIEVADWYAPKELPGAQIGWTGQTLTISPVGIYVSALKNPKPKIQVVSMDIVSSKSSAIGCIISLTTASRKAKTAK